MTGKSVSRLAAVLVSALGLNGCGVAIQNDGHMFQRMADQVSAIQVDGEAQGAARSDTTETADTQAPHESMAVQVVDALDMPHARDAGLRTVLRAVQAGSPTDDEREPIGPKAQAAGLRGALRAAGPLLHMVSGDRAERPGKSVQLAAFPNEQAAHAAWASLRAKSPALLGRLRPEFDHVDLGSKGVWVRIKAGPLTSAEDAHKVCAAAGVNVRWCASAFADPRT
jgi:hypothetical protein